MITKRNLRIPATVVEPGKAFNKARKLRGQLLSINESEKTARVSIKGVTYRDVPITAIRVNEAFLDDVKALAKKGISKLKSAVKSIVKKVKGLLVTNVDGNIPNTPVLIAQQNKNRRGFGIWLDPVNKEIANSNNVSMKDYDIDSVIVADPDDLKKQNEFLQSYLDNIEDAPEVSESLKTVIGRRKYRKSIYESYQKTVRQNEFANRLEKGHWDNVRLEWSKPEALNEADHIELCYNAMCLNEASKMNIDMHDVRVGKTVDDDNVIIPNGSFNDAKSIIETQLLTAVNYKSWEDWNNTNIEMRPLLIWGAPGIGKTQIVRGLVKEFNKVNAKASEALSKFNSMSDEEIEELYEKDPEKLKELTDFEAYTTNEGEPILVSEIYVTCNNMREDDFSLPNSRSASENYKYSSEDRDVLKKHGVSTSSTSVNDIPKTWIPAFVPTGIPEIDEILDKSTYVTSPSEVNAGRNAGILFIDELSRVAATTMNVIMSLVDQRNVGDTGAVLGSHWIIVAAANRESDMGSKTAKNFNWEPAWGSRFNQMNVLPNIKNWLEWAEEINDLTGLPNIHPVITGVIKQNPEALFFITHRTIDKQSAEADKLIALNPRSITAASSNIYNMQKQKSLYGNPENYIDPKTGEKLSRRQILLKQADKQRKNIQGNYDDWSDELNVNDIVKSIGTAIGKDRIDNDAKGRFKWEKAVRSYMLYKNYWSPTRCEEVLTKGEPQDDEDNVYPGMQVGKTTVQKWPNNFVWKGVGMTIEDVFKTILEEQNRRVNSGELIELLCETLENHPEIKFDYEESGLSQRAYLQSLQPIISKELFPNKTFKSFFNGYSNIVQYAFKVAKQVANSHSPLKQNIDNEDIVDLSVLTVLIGDTHGENKFTNGLIYRYMIQPLAQKLGSIMKSKMELDPSINAEDRKKTLKSIMAFLLFTYKNLYIYPIMKKYNAAMAEYA